MIDSASTLVETLRESQLLSATQLRELSANLEASYPEARSLARELLQRGWLTAYQVNRILKGQVKELFLGPYILLERLGEGGMGQVYKARHRLMNRVVALKVIRKERLGSPGAADRFLREIQLSAQLSHTHIILAHDAAQAGDVLYFAMEYVEGSDLDKVVQQRGPLPAAEACEYIRQAALGLQHAHDRGLVHRDIKPHNLLLARKEGQIKILDMGLARLRLQAEAPAGEGLTHEGALMGTPDYMAPEQVLDSHSVDIRADIYSLGCTLYTLLAGQPPFAELPLSQKVGAHIGTQPRRIEEVCQVPAGLGDVLRKMMAKRPQDRYQSPAEVAAVLETFAWRVAPASVVPSARPLPPSASQAATATVGLEGITPEVVSLPAALPLPTPPVAQPAPAAQPTAREPVALPAFLRKMSRRQLLIAGGGVGLAALLPLGLLFRRRPRRGVDSNEEETGLGDKRYPWYPKELIQVLGDDRGRHWGAVRTLAYQPGGGLIASGGDDTVIRLWNAETLREERLPFRGHTAPVRQVLFTPDGKSILSLSNDQTMRLWDLESGEERHRFAGSESVTRLFFSPDGQWVRGLSSFNVLSWKLATTEQGTTVTPPINGSTFACAQLSSDGRFLVIGESTPGARTWYQIRTWNIEANKEEYPPVLGPEKPKGYEDLPERERVKIPTRSLVSLSLAGPARVVLAVSNDGEASLWELSSGARQGSLPHQEPILLAGLDPQGQRALLYTQDGALRLWDVPSGKESGRLEGHKGSVVGLAFSADGTQALTASEDSTLRLWDLASCKELNPRSGHTHLVHDVSFSSDGKQVLTGGADRTMRLWDVADGKELHNLSDHRDAVTSVAFLTDGSQVFSYDRSCAGRLWDVADEHITFSFNWPSNDAPTVFRYSTTAPHAHVGTAQGNLTRYDLTSGKPLGPTANPAHSPAGCLAASEDGNMVLLASSSPTDCFVRLLDLATGRERFRLPGHTEPILALTFLGGESKGLSAGQDKTLRRWDLQGKGKCEEEIDLEGTLPKVITSMTFSPDATLLACSGYDDYKGVVLLWDTDGGRLRARWEMFGPVQRLVFARDSTHLATANANGTVFIYRLDRSRKV